MGNKNSKHASSFSDWERVQTQDQIGIYRNKKNNELAQKRAITIDPHFALDDELKIYHMRQHNHDSLVRAFGAEQVHKKGHSQGICSGHKKLEVLTERMPFRLSDLPQLTFPQSLLFLKESLRAYLRVFKSYGPIHITKRLIGINQFGQVKCWVNENWALNHPNQELPTLQSTKLQGFSNRSTQVGPNSQAYDARYRDETQMVHNIVAVIEQKCEQGKFPNAFSQQVEQHSNSFKRLSTYVQDFIRINELFIPPKINYETVFVSKYQARLVQQHQQSGKQAASNQSQNINQSISNQNQRIVTTGGQNLAYATGGYQQSSQALGYSTNQLQGQYGVGGGYTTTKTTTTTYGNTIGDNSLTSTYQPPSYHAYNTSSSTLNNNNTNTVTIPWQKFQSVYKLPENQSSYSSSYYQYSATNPSSTAVGNYKFGGFSSGNQLRNQPIKPSSYTTLSNGLLGSTSYNYSNLNNQNTFTSLQNKFGSSQNDNPLSPYQNLSTFNKQNKTQYQNYTTSTPQKQTYEQFKKTFNQPNLSANQYGYTATYNLSNAHQPLSLDSAQKGSTFSFDGKKDFTSKFADYSGKGYSNTLNTYETSNNLTSTDTKGVEVEGKYSQQFNSLLGPLLSLKNQFDSTKNKNTQISNQGRCFLIQVSKSNKIQLWHMHDKEPHRISQCIAKQQAVLKTDQIFIFISEIDINKFYFLIFNRAY